MASSGIRVRFAPSPTGHLHVGGLRAALFNWLFAQHNNGVFLLRIEDTDLERSKQEYIDSILNSLAWAGLESDEPLVIQSERKKRHIEVLEQLLAQNKAYKCFCTQEELYERIGLNAAHEGGYTRYDRKCRERKEISEDAYKPYAIRFKIPDTLKHISFIDLVRGYVTFNVDQFDDFIIMRSDGSPMYNFVVVVDDADMHITHVLRGEDHISNTPKQILLYQGCEFDLPLFGHFPLILGYDGSRLSKRDAATAVIDYKNNGFLADALCNYLVRLGWSHGDQEIFTRKELIAYFALEYVNKKGSIFDMKKLEWVNSIYMHMIPAAQLIEYIKHDIDPEFEERISNWNRITREFFIDLYKIRTKTLKELKEKIIFVYQGPKHFEANQIISYVNKQSYTIMQELIKYLEKQEDFMPSVLSTVIKAMAKELNIKLAAIAQPIRLSLTGESSSPSIFELLYLLGKEESLKRLKYFKDILKMIDKHIP